MTASLKTIRTRLDGALSKMLEPEAVARAIRAILQLLDAGQYGPHRALSECSFLLDGHGVEAICPEANDTPIAWYVNMGDTYDCTLVYSVRTARVYVTSWGDWYEHSPEYRKRARD